MNRRSCYRTCLTRRKHVVAQNLYIEMIPDAASSTFKAYERAERQYHNKEDMRLLRHRFLPTLLIPCSTPLNYEDLPQHPSSIVRRINECVRRREGETGQSMKLKESGVVQSIPQGERVVQSPQPKEQLRHPPQQEELLRHPQLEEHAVQSPRQGEQVKQSVQEEQLNHPPQQTDKTPLEYHFSECCNPAMKMQAPEGVFPFSEAYSFTECLEDGSVANSAEDHQMYSFSSVCGVCSLTIYGLNQHSRKSISHHQEEERRAGEVSSRCLRGESPRRGFVVVVGSSIDSPYA